VKEQQHVFGPSSLNLGQGFSECVNCLSLLWCDRILKFVIFVFVDYYVVGNHHLFLEMRQYII
jgi:hypothetical protein